ncbi:MULTISPECIES: hypothetical protein [Hymenobacter]|uniref:Uncharacterized protein n=1 Tax=Hymenobacter mucosus TaxID=1411120 RepID=A0A238XY18_9BACT|nr:MULTISPECIES: hypothetical protein [Hymenobacter]SNR63807.1 hypothetical protein SAMN06269173_104486 [Hymenobacter mucosus]
MKHLTKGILTTVGLLWPMVTYAGEREDKYTLLQIGGIGGMIAGVGLYVLLMLLTAVFVRTKKLAVAAGVFCWVLLAYTQFLSVRTLRLAAGLLQTTSAVPTLAPLPGYLLAALVSIALFALAVLVVARRIWKERHRPRRPPGFGEASSEYR